MRLRPSLLLALMVAGWPLTSFAQETQTPEIVLQEEALPFIQPPEPEIQLYDPTNKWQTLLDLQAAGGDERFFSEGEFFVPLWQSDRDLLFTNLRGRLDDEDNSEVSIGGGYRIMTQSGWILGAYGFFDYQNSEFNNEFYQGMAGIELLNEIWDFRINGYLPEAGARPADPLSVAEFDGNTIVFRAGEERAYHGFDAEIGARLMTFGNECNELRGFVGGYHFDTNDESFPEVSGPRARVEMRLFDLAWLGGYGSRVTLGAEIQWDDLRDTQGLGSLRVRIPLGRIGRDYIEPRTRGCAQTLDRRMVDPIRREDLFTFAQTSTTAEMAIDPETGLPFGELIVIDANTPDPIATVADAGNDSTVIVDGSQGQIEVGETIFTQDGQTLRGAGFVVQGADSGRTTTFGTRPTIVGTSTGFTFEGGRSVIGVNNNTTIRDLDVVGGARGFLGAIDGSFDQNDDDVMNVTMIGNSASGASFAGFQFDDVSNSLFQNNLAENNGDNGFTFESFSGTLSDNIARSNTSDGFEVEDNLEGTMANNLAEGNSNDGFNLTIGEDNSSAIFSMTGNVARENGGDGFEIEDLTDNTMISDNLAVDNDRDGYLLNDPVQGTFSNNVSQSSGEAGFELEDGVSPTGSFTGNTASGNGQSGFTLDDEGNAGIFTGNTASGNMENGFQFGMNTGTFTGNTAENNGGDGFTGDPNTNVNFQQDAGTFSDNVANNNGDQGYRGDNNGGTVNNNTGSGNANGGNTFP